MGDRKAMDKGKTPLRGIPLFKKYPKRARLFVERSRRGLDIETLAKEIGISKSHLHRIEMGEWDPNPDIAIALEEKLGVNRKSLMKKYDKLLGIPNRKCNKHRKFKTRIVISWDPLWVLREQLREAWGLSEESAVGRKHDTDPSLNFTGGGRDDEAPGGC